MGEAEGYENGPTRPGREKVLRLGGGLLRERVLLCTSKGRHRVVGGVFVYPYYT